MKALAIIGLLVLSLSAFDQKSAEDSPGVLLHGDGQHGTLRMTVVDPNGEPAKHVGVQVFWLCPEACQIVVSSMLTNSVGELRFDPITVGKYLVCSSADTDSLRPCFIDASAPSCTVEITNENPKVELRMQIPKHLSENGSLDVVEEALRSGGSGYVLKSDAAGDLVLAVETILQGKRFVSASLSGMSSDRPDPRSGYRLFTNNVIAVTSPPKRHEAGFYSDDRRSLEHLTQFVGAALKGGNAAIVAATESHRDALIPRLQAYGVDIGKAIEQGRYVALDAAEALAAFIHNRMPDPARFVKLFHQLILTVEEASSAKHPRVAIFGESVNLLWAEGNAEAAIQTEKLGNQLIKAYDVDILCAYFPLGVAGGMDEHTFQRICAEHSTVHDR